MRVEFQNTESRSSARIHSSTGKAAAAPTRAVAMAERQTMKAVAQRVLDGELAPA